VQAPPAANAADVPMGSRAAPIEELLMGSMFKLTNTGLSKSRVGSNPIALITCGQRTTQAERGGIQAPGTQQKSL